MANMATIDLTTYEQHLRDMCKNNIPLSKGAADVAGAALGIAASMLIPSPVEKAAIVFAGLGLGHYAKGKVEDECIRNGLELMQRTRRDSAPAK